MYIYFGLTILAALFGIIYESFSHNVFSVNMSFAWAWLLGFGVTVYALLAFLPIKKVPGTIPSSIYNFGVAMITIRSIFIGVAEIYGNLSVVREEMLYAYLIISLIFLIPGSFMYIGIVIDQLIKRHKNNEEEI